MLLFWVFEIVAASAVLGLLIAAWIIGRRPRTSADQKPSTGKRTAILLLRIQTLVPLPLFALGNMISVDPTQHRSPPYSGTIILYAALLGEVLTIPIIGMWLRYGQGKQRVIGVAMSIVCALFIILLVVIDTATA